MSKELITLNNVFDKDKHYHDILYLLIEFHNNDGLTFEQLRYILVNQQCLKATPLRVINFLTNPKNQNRLQPLIDTKKIKLNAIKSEKSLNNFLKRLLPPTDKNPKGLNIIKKDSRNKKPRYKIRKNFLIEGLRIQHKLNLDDYKSSHIISYTADFKEIPPYKESPVSVILYGINKNIHTQNKKEINKHIYEIENHLREIERIKATIITDKFQEMLEKICDKYNNEKLKKYVKKRFDEFLQLDEFKNINVREPWVLEFLSNESLGMTIDDRIEFLYDVIQSNKKLYNDLHNDLFPAPIALSRHINVFPIKFIEQLKRCS